MTTEVIMKKIPTIEEINDFAEINETLSNLKTKYDIEHDNKLDKIRKEQYANEKKMAVLQRTIISATLSDILMRLAATWKTSSSALKASFVTRFDFDLYDFEPIDVINFADDIKSSLPSITKTIPMTFTIEETTRPNRKVILPEIEVPLDSVQPDGKPLLEHIKPKFSLPQSGVGRVEIKLDNYKNLILPFPINKLCKFNGTKYEPKNPVTEAILDAGQMYDDKKVENPKAFV